MAIPRQSVNLSGREFKALLRALISGRIIAGPQLGKFEFEFARYIGVRYALSVSSGRAAQYLALKALELNEGDEIIVPAYTFYIVPAIVRSMGLKPVFVDADKRTYNFDLSQLEEKIGPRTRCIIATHIAGQPSDMDKIMRIAKQHKLFVLEDCAEACGGEYKGKKLGSFGDMGYFSFHISKNMTCLGGGALVTNNEELSCRIRKLAGEIEAVSRREVLRNLLYAVFTYLCTRKIIFTVSAYPLIIISHLINSDWIDGKFREKVSGNIHSVNVARMANLQASVGLAQLKRLDSMNESRFRNAMILHNALKNCSEVKMQDFLTEARNAYLYFYLQIPRKKNEVRRMLAFAGIDSKEDGLAECIRDAAFSVEDYPVARSLVETNIELPNFPSIREKDMYIISEKVKGILGSI